MRIVWCLGGTMESSFGAEQSLTIFLFWQWPWVAFQGQSRTKLAMGSISRTVVDGFQHRPAPAQTTHIVESLINHFSTKQEVKAVCQTTMPNYAMRMSTETGIPVRFYSSVTCTSFSCRGHSRGLFLWQSLTNMHCARRLFDGVVLQQTFGWSVAFSVRDTVEYQRFWHTY